MSDANAWYGFCDLVGVTTLGCLLLEPGGDVLIDVAFGLLGINSAAVTEVNLIYCLAKIN